jgi:DNA polymerase-3 subunit delta
MPSTAQQNPAPIYAVCGTETFLKRQAMDQIIKDVLGNADRALAMSEYDCATTTAELASVLDDLRTLPFLTDRRLVVVREADKFITLYRQALEEYASSPSPTGVLLIECKSLPGNTRLAKQIAKIGQVLKFDPLAAYKVPGWLASYCKDQYGVQIDQKAAMKLVDLVGPDLGLLDAELQKCVLYISGRKQITLADIEVLVGQQREEQVWGILSAIGEGDERKALRLWEEVCQTDRAAEARAVGGIAFTVRRLLKAKRAQEAGASSGELMKEMWIRDERQLRRELGAFTTAQVEDMLSRLLETDVGAKSGLASVQTSIERLIIEMSRRSASRRVAR